MKIELGSIVETSDGTSGQVVELRQRTAVIDTGLRCVEVEIEDLTGAEY